MQDRNDFFKLYNFKLNNVSFDYIHEIDSKNIFEWKNDFFVNDCLQFIADDPKKTEFRITNYNRKEINLSFQVDNDISDKDKITVIKNFPIAITIRFFRPIIKTCHFFIEIMETFLKYPPLCLFAPRSYIKNIMRLLIEKWGYKKVLKSLNSFKYNEDSNKKQEFFIIEGLNYIYKFKMAKFYKFILNSIYSKDINQILVCYIDY